MWEAIISPFQVWGDMFLLPIIIILRAPVRIWSPMFMGFILLLIEWGEAFHLFIIWGVRRYLLLSPILSPLTRRQWVILLHPQVVRHLHHLVLQPLHHLPLLKVRA